MASKRRTCIANLKTLLEGVNDGAVPAHNHYYDAVYIGMPDKIPTGNKHVAIIQPVTDPSFGYTTCPTNYVYDFQVYISVMTKGVLSNATLDNLDVLEATITALRNDRKLSGACTDSTIEDIIYGDYGYEKRNLLAASRITFKINLEAI